MQNDYSSYTNSTKINVISVCVCVCVCVWPALIPTGMEQIKDAINT